MLEKLQIEGGCVLHGDVHISGAKNAALPMMCLSLLTEEPCTLSNVPDLHDVKGLLSILNYIGVESFFEQDPETLVLSGKNLQAKEAPYDMVRKMRASILILGPMLARFGEAKISLPGGCAIGVRPVDQHLKAMESMGADIKVENGYVFAKAKQLKPTDFTFSMVTVTGTMNALMAAALISSAKSTFRNCAFEPEVVQLCQMLCAMGCDIDGIGTSTLHIQGKTSLSGFKCSLIPDRIEAGTYAIAAGITGGEVFLKDCQEILLAEVFGVLRACGLDAESKDGGVWVKGNDSLTAHSIKTQVYPGFPTDLQAQYMALMTVAQGECTIEETIFENRFMHVAELNRMGAKIKIDGSIAKITGVAQLTGAPVMATDLRASAGLVLAGLAAQGVTEVMRIYHLDRGYVSMEKKLEALGAKIKRLPQ
ncbi:MAG TPA: UDP-N-acetylglucosamine 1-carboxyvinyltransferase [Oligoflexia bacterium]|nr:UDP-N-acetylglucosamine 1-carboxyvinyltransferase [Oligoflexia bacterium]HMR24899.1 UDP-N-acetylglucosamine 1-carboxyvinyltransferase [Oligoflexia bacterium]